VTQLEEKFKSLEEALAWFLAHQKFLWSWTLRETWWFLVHGPYRLVILVDNLLQALGLVPIICYTMDSKMQLLIVTIHSIHSFGCHLLNIIFGFSFIVMTCLYWLTYLIWRWQRLIISASFNYQTKTIYQHSATRRVSLNISSASASVTNNNSLAFSTANQALFRLLQNISMMDTQLLSL
jgi:hypothetical protein